MTFQEYHALIAGTYKSYLLRRKDLRRWDYTKDSEMERLSWIIKRALNAKGPYKMEAEGDFTNTHEEAT